MTCLCHKWPCVSPSCELRQDYRVARLFAYARPRSLACYVRSTIHVPDCSISGTCGYNRCHCCALVRPEIVNYVAFGTSRAQAVDQNVALCGKTVPLALWKEAQASGIMNPLIPLPGDDAEPAAKKAKN